MKTLFAAAMTLSLLMGAATTASAGDHDHDRGDRGHDGRGHDRRDDDRRHDRRDDRHDNRHDGHRWDGRRGDSHFDSNRGNWDSRRDGDRRNWNDGRHDRDWNRSRGWSDRDYRSGYAHGRVDQYRFQRGRYIPPHGYYHHYWRRGDRLPVAYYGSRYIVHDYHVYHLHAPPRGYHWVRVDNDVVLAAITSGIVVSVVSGMFY